MRFEQEFDKSYDVRLALTSWAYGSYDAFFPSQAVLQTSSSATPASSSSVACSRSITQGSGGSESPASPSTARNDQSAISP